MSVVHRELKDVCRSVQQPPPFTAKLPCETNPQDYLICIHLYSPEMNSNYNIHYKKITTITFITISKYNMHYERKKK